MTIYDDILFVILTAALFLQGFYFARNQMLKVVIVSFILIISDVVCTIMNGGHTFSDTINIHEATAAIIYVISLWGFGYFAGLFILLKDSDIGVRRINFMKIKKKSWTNKLGKTK
jgi:hypothetical protein